jgi:hypothetical protein
MPDHGQNCSTSTARMVGSTTVNLFSTISAAKGIGLSFRLPGGELNWSPGKGDRYVHTTRPTS